MALFSVIFTLFIILSFNHINGVSRCTMNPESGVYLCKDVVQTPKWRDMVKITQTYFYNTSYYPYWNTKVWLANLRYTLINSTRLPCNNITNPGGVMLRVESKCELFYVNVKFLCIK